MNEELKKLIIEWLKNEKKDGLLPSYSEIYRLCIKVRDEAQRDFSSKSCGIIEEEWTKFLNSHGLVDIKSMLKVLDNIVKRIKELQP